MKTKLVDYCTRDYEGDCKFAKTVVILGVGDPTISGYHGEVDYEDMADKSDRMNEIVDDMTNYYKDIVNITESYDAVEAINVDIGESLSGDVIN